VLSQLQREVRDRLAAKPVTSRDPLIVIIDELANLRTRMPESFRQVADLAKTAREANIHLLLITQTSEDVPDGILGQVRARLIFRLGSAKASKRALGHDRASGLRPREMFFKFGDVEELVRVPSLPS
jgi:DNA helicase HerA-like ATPase